MSKRAPRKQKSTRSQKLTLLYLSFIVLFLGFWILIIINASHVSGSDSGPEAEETVINGSMEPGDPEGTIVAKQASLIFVIDDVGQNISQLEPFLQLDFPVTYAIIPFLPDSLLSMQVLEERDQEMILHMPMEPFGDNDPGPGAIFSEDTPEVVQNKLLEALEELKLVVGANNHMGSKVTSSGDIMRVVLEVLESRNLFYLDSLTTPTSIVDELGKELNIVTLERDVFLDNEKNRESILKAIEEGKEIARKKGHAVMIGHVWTEELASLLLEIYPEALEEGFTLDDLSSLLDGGIQSEPSGD